MPPPGSYFSRRAREREDARHPWENSYVLVHSTTPPSCSRTRVVDFDLALLNTHLVINPASSPTRWHATSSVFQLVLLATEAVETK